MLKWLFTLVLVALIIGVFTPWLRGGAPDKRDSRRFPGDFDVERGAKRFSFPVGSTIVLSLLASLIFWLLR
jgi:hypothetical protein